GTKTVGALNMQCAAPAGGLSVTITPGNNKLTLKDNGKGPELAGGDGIYSASWTPCATGTYTLDYSNGSTDTVTVAGLVPCVSLRPRSGPPGSTATLKGR